MRIRMLTSFAGPRVNWEAGTEVDVPEETAKRFIARGHAEVIKPAKAKANKAPEPETATEPEVETASKRPAATRGRRRKKD